MAIVMNVCLCGVEAGYPHDEYCPYPLYRAETEREQLWRDAYERNVNRHPPQVADDAERLDKWIF